MEEINTPENFKWNWGIDQKAIIQSGLDIDIVDFSIIRMLVDFSASRACRKMTENETTHYMFRWQLIKTQLPILKLTTRQSIGRRVSKLIKLDILNAHKDNRKNRSAWYSFGKSMELLINPKCNPKLPSATQKLHGATESCEDDNFGLHDTTTILKQTKESDFKEQSRKALELIALTEKITSTLSDFCTMNEPKLELMKNKALFKGEYRNQLLAFVEHNIENILFRSSPITFFVKKFTQWLRYAKSFNKGKARKAPNSYTKIMNEYYIPEIREKIRVRQPERFKAYETEFNDVVVRAEIETNLKKLKNVKNKSYTPYLIFDICYGMLADKAGTKPERRYSKFKQWYNKLNSYKQNQSNLREDFKNFINS